MHTAEPLEPESNCFEVEIVIKKPKRYKSPDTDQILAELIQVGGNTLCSMIHTLINSISNKNNHSSGRYLLLHLFIKRGDIADCCNYRGISLLLIT